MRTACTVVIFADDAKIGENKSSEEDTRTLQRDTVKHETKVKTKVID